MESRKKLSAKETVHLMYGKGKYYSSIIHEITKEGRLIIYTPEEEIIKMSLSKMEEIIICFNREDAQYQFTAVIERQYYEGQLELTELRQVSEIKRIQRREYYRLKKVLPVKVRLYTADDDDKYRDDQSKKGERSWTKAFTVDISADGVRICSKIKWQVESIIEIILSLDGVTFRLKGKILGVKESVDDSQVYLARAKFLDIDKQQRDIIIRYIFKEQLELRSKGIL